MKVIGAIAFDRVIGAGSACVISRAAATAHCDPSYLQAMPRPWSNRRSGEGLLPEWLYRALSTGVCTGGDGPLCMDCYGPRCSSRSLTSVAYQRGSDPTG